MDTQDSLNVMLCSDITAENKQRAKEVISRPIPKELIKQREGAGKMMLSYIEGETVIRLLNEAFGENGWSFQVVSKDVLQAEPKQATQYNQTTRRSEKLLNEDGTPKLEHQPPIVEVLGRLIVPGFGVREQFGTKSLIGGSAEQEGAAKSATTDALKKCATLFGIGLELYDDKAAANKSSAPQSNNSYHNNNYSKPAAPVKQEGTAWESKKAEIQRLKELKAIMGIESNPQLNPYVAELTGIKNATHEMITPDNIKSFNDFLEKKAAMM
jgi:recombination DNA repair RAD52 pathway protein